MLIETNDYLSVNEAARLLGCKPKTLRERIRREHVQVTKLFTATAIPRDALALLDKRPLT